MKRILALAALAALSVAGTSSANTTTYSESIRYTGIIGDAYTLDCAGSQPETGGIGGVCFALTGEELEVDFVVEDDHSPFSVGGVARFTDSLGGAPTDPEPTVLAERPFCGRVSDFEVPEGAAHLLIFIDGPVFGPQDCGTDVGIGTQGAVTATFTIPA